MCAWNLLAGKQCQKVLLIGCLSDGGAYVLKSERGALGSRLHRGSDGIWYAYAQWSSAEARAIAFSLPSVDPQAEADVVDSILEYFPEIVLHPVEDQLVPVSELAPGNSFKPEPA